MLYGSVSHLDVLIYLSVSPHNYIIERRVLDLSYGLKQLRNLYLTSQVDGLTKWALGTYKVGPSDVGLLTEAFLT